MACVAGKNFNAESLGRSSLSGQAKISGRTLLALAHKNLKHCKFALAFRSLFMQGVTAQDPVGCFPSGMNQDDADAYLITKVRGKIAGESNICAATASSSGLSSADDDDDAADMAALSVEGGSRDESDFGLDESAGAGDGDGGRGPLFVGFIPFCLFGPDAPMKYRSHLIGTSDVIGSRELQRKLSLEKANQDRKSDPGRGLSGEELKERAEIAQEDDRLAQKELDRLVLMYSITSKSLENRMQMELMLMNSVPDQTVKDACLAKYRLLSIEVEEIQSKVSALSQGKRKANKAVAEYLDFKSKKSKRDSIGSGGESSSSNENDGL